MTDTIKNAQILFTRTSTDPLDDNEVAVEEVAAPLIAIGGRPIYIEQITAGAEELPKLYAAAEKDNDRDYVFLVGDDGNRYVVYGNDLDAQEGLIGLPSEGVIRFETSDGSKLSGIIVNSCDNWQLGDYAELSAGMVLAGLVKGIAQANPGTIVVTLLFGGQIADGLSTAARSGGDPGKTSITQGYESRSAGQTLMESGIAPPTRK